MSDVTSPTATKPASPEPEKPVEATYFAPVRGFEVAKRAVEATRSDVVREVPAHSSRPSASPAPVPVAMPAAPHAAPRTAFPFLSRAPQEAPQAEAPAEPSSPEPVAMKPAVEGPAQRLPFVMDAPRADARVDAPRIDAPVVRAYAEHRAATQAEAKQPALPETAPRPVEAKTQSDAAPDRGTSFNHEQREEAPAQAEFTASREVARPSAPAEPPSVPAVRVATPSQPTAPSAETVAPRDLLPLPHEALAQTILSRARVLPENGAVQLRFALEPADLGAVSVRIEARGRQVKIEIETATHAAASILAPGVAKLTAELHSAGYHDPQVSVGPDAGGGREASSETGQRETSPRERRGNAQPSRNPYERAKSDGRLDRTA